MNQEKYIKGFNSGYVLAEHSPKLLHLITANLSSAGEYVEGLKNGGIQFENGKTQEQLQSLSKLRERAKTRTNDLGRQLE
jgi:hypothetical protein